VRCYDQLGMTSCYVAKLRGSKGSSSSTHAWLLLLLLYTACMLVALEIRNCRKLFAR
jgi:hypothetical protein